MATYLKVNKEAAAFTRPTSQIKKADLEKLIAASKEEDLLPPTVRYPQVA